MKQNLRKKRNIHHMMKQTALFAIMGFCLLFTSCRSNYEVDNRLLTVSIEPLRYVTEAIAGDCFEVVTLTPEGVSPETYMPTPQQIININKGAAYIYLGSLGFEQQHMNHIIENCPHLYVVNVSENISLLHGHHCENASTDSADPHIWTSPKNMRAIANNICKALCLMDTANARTYTENMEKFTARIDSVNHAIHSELDTLQNRTFLINHPALAYFADQYGLHQLSIEKDGKEASAERVAQLIDASKKENVKTVFILKQNSGRAATRIAEEIGAETIVINPLLYQWDEEILRIAKALKR